MKRFFTTLADGMWLLPAAFALVLLAGAGCGTGGEPLDQGLTGCPGCMENGVCRPFSAQDSTACGSGGRSCERCQQGTESCDRDVGRCVAANPGACPGGVCPPTAKKPCGLLCDGCCDPATNTCIETNAGQSAQKCGVNNQVCRACDAGQSCNAGACVFGGGGIPGNPGSCNQALQCYSQTTKTCELGDSVLACGRPGSTCAVCQNGTYCSNGTCVAGTNRVAECQRNGCDGCCDATGTCVGSWAITDSQCATRGRACQNCMNLLQGQGVCDKTAGVCKSQAQMRPNHICIDGVWLTPPDGQEPNLEGVEVRVELGESTLGIGTISGTTDTGALGAPETACPGRTGRCSRVTFGEPCAIRDATESDLARYTVNFEVGKAGFLGWELFGGTTLATCRVRGVDLTRYFKDPVTSGLGGYSPFQQQVPAGIGFTTVNIPGNRFLNQCVSSTGWRVFLSVRVSAL